MLARIFTGLFFLLYALAALVHAPVAGVILAIVALVAGICVLAGA